MLRDLKQALSERGLDFTWDESVIDALVKKSYSVTYGARNLRRTIQKELEDPIAQKIIESFVYTARFCRCRWRVYCYRRMRSPPPEESGGGFV